MKDAISWFKKTVTGENLYSNEGYKDFEVALLMAKKEVFDDIDKLKLNYQGSHKIIDEEDYQELKQHHFQPTSRELNKGD